MSFRLWNLPCIWEAALVQWLLFIQTLILLHFEGLENSINELKATFFGSLMKEGILKLTSLSHWS